MTLLHPRVAPSYVEEPDAEALIREARRLRRRRWMVGTAVALLVAAGAGVVIGFSGSKGGRPIVEQALATTSDGVTVNAAAMRGQGDLAFVSRGDLFVIDGKSGKTVNVTGRNDTATTPVYSPDGDWLLYETNSGVTSWLARANGAESRKLTGTATWLPNDALAITTSTTSADYSIGTTGALKRVGVSKAASEFGTARSPIYAYSTSTLKVEQSRSSSGVEEIETSRSPNGPRTLWYSARVSFTHAGGLQGTFLSLVGVLPGGQGILLTIDNYCCDYADGHQLYELLTLGGTPKLLGTVLTASEIPTYGPNGTFALAAGGNRYAWVNKQIELCAEATAKCEPVPVPSGSVTVAPAWSPNKQTLAYVEAKAGTEGAIGQAQIAQWYATHHLYLLSALSKVPVEVPGTQGAMAPVWSSDSRSLMFVRNDDLFLVAKRGAKPVEIAGPLFHPSGWWSNSAQIAYYGEVDWNAQFSWSKEGS